MRSPRHLSTLSTLFACGLGLFAVAETPTGTPRYHGAIIVPEILNGADPRVSVQYPVAPDANFVVEYREAFASQDCPEWRQMPGAPHNRGHLIDAVGHAPRFYRVLRIDTPQSPLFAMLGNDTGRFRDDGVTSDARIVGMAARESTMDRLLVSFDAPAGPFADITSAIDENERFSLAQTEVETIAGGALEDGRHTVYLRIADSGGSILEDHTVDFVYDGQAPAIQVELAPESAARAPFLDTAGRHRITLQGQTDPDQVIILKPGSREARAGADGRFQIANVTAFPGDNLFTLSARDEACNEGWLTVSVPLGAPLRMNAQKSMLETFPDWVVEERGGSDDGRGSVFLEDSKPLLYSGDSTLVSLEMDFTVPAEASTLLIRLSELSVGERATVGIEDAVEALLLDAYGNSRVFTIDPGTPQRDAFFNQTARSPGQAAPGAEVEENTLSLNLSGIPAGTASRLLIRLVSNDPTTTTRVKVRSIETLSGADPLPPGVAPAPASPTAGGGARGPQIDVSTLVDVTASVGVEYGQTTFHELSRTVFADLAVSNLGAANLRGPILVLVDRIDHPTVKVRQASGWTPQGVPYYNLADQLSGGQLAPGDDPIATELAFYNPDGVHFDYRLRFFALRNHNPEFGTLPMLETVAGSAVGATIPVSDPDGDPVVLELLAHPPGMVLGGDGYNLQWSPSADDVGLHAVELLVTDGRGGSARQSLAVRVLAVETPNRPPSVASDPLVAATVGEVYQYALVVVDPDGDPVTISPAVAPGGFAYDESDQTARWTPTAGQTGAHPVEFHLSDGRGGTAQQSYTIFVADAASNNDPQFITSPPLEHTLPGLSNPASGDVTPGRLALELDPGESWAGSVSLQVADGSAMTGGAEIVFLVDESGSMAGEHAWLSEMVPSLESALTARGIGPNRYFLGGYTLFPRLHNFGSHLQLEVFGPDHQRFATDTWETLQGTAGPSITFPRDGDYTLVFQPVASSPSLDYDLGVRLSSADTAPLSGFDTVYAGSLPGGEIFETTFSAPAGEIVLVDVQDIHNLDRSIFAPDGEEIENFFTDDSDPVSLPMAGTYTVRMRNGSSTERDYRFRLLRLSTELPLNTQITGTLTSGASGESGLASQLFYYDGTAGETLFIAANGPVRNGQFILYGPDDVSLGHAFFNGERQYQLAATGRYTLLVAADDDAAPVDFQLVASPSVINEQTISLNTVINGELTQPGQIDRYAFAGTRGQKLFFDGLASAHGGIEGALHSPSGIELFNDRRNIFRDLTNDHGFFILPEDGIYRVTVDGDGSGIGTYAFRLLDPDVHSTAITPSTDLAGTLSHPSGVDFYRFEGTAGDRLFLDVLDTTGGLNWTVRSPRNVQTFFNSLGMRDREVILEETGTYYLQIIGRDDDELPTFVTRINRASALEQTAPFNTLIEGTIAQAGDQPVYTFEGSAGDRFVFDGHERATTAFFAALYDPTNEELANQNPRSDAGPRTLTQDGTYRYRVSAGDDTGDFKFQLLTPQPLSLGTPQSGPLDPRETIAWRFDGIAGQTADFTTTTSSGSGTWILYDPFDRQIRSTNRLNDFSEVLPADGEYLLVLENSSASEDSSYAFEVTLSGPSATAPSGFETVQSDSVAPGATVDFALTAPAGTLTYFDYLRDDEPDFRVQLIAPDTELVFNDSSARDRGPIVLEQSGTYTIRFINESASETHALAFRFLGTPSALTLDAPVSGVLEDDAMGYAAAWYRFAGNAGQFLYIDPVTGTNPSRWQVLTAAGDDLVNDTLNDALFTTLSATQDYLLLLDGDGSDPVPYEFQAGLLDLPIEALSFGAPVAGTVSPRASKFYAIELAAGDLIFFDGLSASGPVRIYLRDPLDGIRINALDPDADSDPVFAPHAGTYILEVENRGDEAGEYGFRVLDPTAAPELPLGVETTGPLDPGTSAQLYRLPVSVLQRIYFDPQAISGGGDYRFYASDGDLLETTTSADREFELIGPGPSYLAVRGGAADPTSFTFAAHAPDDLIANATFGETLAGTIMTPGARHVYRFAGQSGQRVRFNSVTPPGLENTSARLVGPGGEILGETSFAVDDIGPVALPHDATYHLVIDGNSAATNSYTAHLLELSEAPLFSSGDTVAGEFSMPGAALTLRVRASAGQTLRVGNNLLGTSATEVLDGFAELSTGAGGNENGYRALEAAAALPFRDGAAVNFILVTDEDCDCEGPVEELLPAMLAELDAIGATLNVVVNAVIRDGDDATAVGVDSDLITYLPDGAGGFIPSTPGTTKSGAAAANASAAGTKDQYIDLAWATGGAAWDLNQLREGGLLADSFTAAFVEIKAEEIVTQLASLDLLASDGTAPFSNLTGPLANIGTGEEAVFEISLHGEEIARTFDLLFVRPNSGTIIGSIPVVLAPPYRYAAEALDADGDPVTYALSVAPPEAIVDPSSGLLEWNPLAPGVYPFSLTASDGNGGNAQQDFAVDVSVNDDNTPPAILGLPGTVATAGRSFTGPVRAEDDDGDPLSFFFDEAPEGMEIGRFSGLVTWVPTGAQVGDHLVTVRVIDRRGGQATDSFEVTVRPDTGNARPLFESAPVLVAEPGVDYRYEAFASDADGDTVTYSLPVAPSGMSVGAASGVVVWTPTSAASGTANVVLRADDGHGGVTLQVFAIDVAGVNAAPVFLSAPPRFAGIETPYVYRPEVQEADGDLLAFFLPTGPAAMSVDGSTGRLDWTPTVDDLGDHAIVLEVRDARGAVASQAFTLEVIDLLANDPPVISSSPRLVTALGTEWFYLIAASDPNDDPLTFTLETAPTGMSLETSGLIRWTPTPGQFGPNPVTIRAEDPYGAFASQSFTVEVGSLDANAVPQITSEPTLVTVVDRSYAYDATATDADGDPLVWELQTAPAGMSVNALGGTVRWTPTTSQIGENPVELTVTDALGTSDTQAFSIIVNPVNTPPSITSAPVVTAAADANYLYLVVATDAEGDPLAFTVTSAPAGLSIDPVSGLVQWSPLAADVGSHSVVLEVVDGFGGTASQSYLLEVVDTAPNDPPTITSTPTFAATADTLYTYAVLATDPESDPLTYTLPTAPPGMSIDGDGLVTWTPSAAQAGAHPVRVLVSDDRGNAAYQDFNVTVLVANAPPAISSAPTGPATAGEPYAYDVVANDPDGDPLAYFLVTAPPGMTIDNEGRIRWTPDVSDGGNVPVEVRVEDPAGAFASQDFNLPVLVDMEAPEVLLSLSTNPSLTGEPVTVTVAATDDVAVTELLATFDGVPLALNGLGQATITPDTAGNYPIAATARDALGNEGTDALTLVVSDTPDSSAPHVFIHSPEPSDSITTFTDVVATVTDTDLAFYALEVAPADGGEFREILRGTDPVDEGVIGAFDPTLLENGPYRLRLVAEDFIGQRSIDEIRVDVAGSLKLGNYRITFNDLVIPVSGIPISVSRTYDTLRASRSGDLGFGWRLELSETRLRTTLSDLAEPGDEILPAFRVGTRVFVTLPSGRREGFTFNAELNNPFFPIFDPVFIADVGVDSTLEVDTHDLRYNDVTGEFESYIDRLPYNPGAPAFGGVYRLTTKEGLTYRIDGITGDLVDLSDRNGNTLTFEEAGIFSSTGEQVDFERDPQGRISAVIDPAGQRIEYSYDTAGNLVAVTDREDNTTTYHYRTDPAHYLEEIRDPLGRMGERSEYDEDGRLIRRINGAGTVLEFVYDPENSLHTTVDALGNETILEYDPFGNILTEVDPLGGVRTNVYDGDHRLISTTDPEGLTTTYSYDERGNVLSRTDPRGETRYSTYNQFDLPVTETDPLGNVTTHAYDASGNRTATTDPLGRTTSYTYNHRGDRTSITDALGQTTAFSYDSRGYLTAIEDPNGDTTTFTNDDRGNRTSQTVTRQTPDGPVVVTRTMTYDAEDNLLSETDGEGNVTSMEYDFYGRLIAVTDGGGQRIDISINEAGRVTALDVPARGRTEIDYDAKDRLTRRVDPDGRTNRLEYDANDRVVAVLLPDDTPEVLEDNPARRFEYDGLGRRTAVIDERGHRTEFEYDPAGRLVVHRDALGHETHYTYDAAGRRTSATDPLGRTTTYTYDAAGQLLTTTHPDGATETNLYDDAGRRTAVVDPLGHTTVFEYDALDRLTAVVNPLGERTAYAYDTLGNLVLQTDALDRETRFEYDNAGRRLATVRPLGQRLSATYDAAGNLLGSGRADGTEITYEYDAGNRPIRTHLPDGGTETFAYDVQDRLTSVTAAEGEIQYTYNDRGRLSSRILPDGRFIDYTYDATNNTTARTSPAGTVAHTFDALDRIATVTDQDGGVTTYTYDDVGNRIGATFPNGVIETRTYDTRDRLLRLMQTAGSNTVVDFQYTYDAAGRRTRVTEADGRQIDYTYDDADRLVGETITEPDNTVRGISYTYDAVGNRLSRNDTAEGLTTYAYNANDWLVTETRPSETLTHVYDANGNLTRSESTSGDLTLYEWDARDRLTAVEVNGQRSEYRYDHTGTRIAMTVEGVETRFLVDTRGTFPVIVEESNATGDVLVSYARGAGLISRAAAGARHHVAPDALGSTRALTDATGSVSDTFAYDAFGRALARTGGTDFRHRFAGEPFDDATGLLYLRARYLDPDRGRFLSADPFQGTPIRPSSLHRYTYASNNPVNITDPSGRWDLVNINIATAIVSDFQQAFGKAGMTAMTTIRNRAAQLSALGSPLRNNGLNLIASNYEIGIVVFDRGEEMLALAMEQIRESLSQIGVDTIKNLKLLGGPVTGFVRDVYLSGDLGGTIFDTFFAPVNEYLDAIDSTSEALSAFIHDPSRENFISALSETHGALNKFLPEGPPPLVIPPEILSQFE